MINFFLLLNDGTSYLLLSDAVSKLIIESAAPGPPFDGVVWNTCKTGVSIEDIAPVSP